MKIDNVQIVFLQSSPLAKIDRFFAEIGLGVNPAGLRRQRLGQVIALEEKSDRDLARMGLRREDIVPHVFRDLFCA